MTINIKGSPAGNINISGTGGEVKMFTVQVPSFDPISLGGLKAWYNASALAGLANGDAITTWADGSGFGNTLTSYGAQISYLSADSLLNNMPVASFAGNAFMDLPFASGNTIPTGDSFTLYTVGYSAESTGCYAFMGGPGAWQQMLGFMSYADTTLCNLNGTNAATKAISVNTPVILSYGYQSGTGSGDNLLYVNGSNAGVSQTGSAEVVNLNQGFRIGARYAYDVFPLTGHVAEVILYLGKHSDGDRSLVTAYLATKYGITI